MAFISLSIPELYQRTFGAQMPEQAQYDPANASDERRRQHGKHGARLWGTGENGLDYYMPAVVGYTTRVNGSAVDKLLELPYPVLSYRGGWNIVKTPLTQRSGTFKQIVGQNDYEITVRGLIVSQDNSLPEDKMGDLKAFFEATGTKTLKCALTDIPLNGQPGGKLNVVVEDWDFPETRGVVNVRGYAFRLVSDSRFNLIEKV